MEGQNEVRMEATPVASLQTLEKQFTGQLQHKAAETWNYPGDSPLAHKCAPCSVSLAVSPGADLDFGWTCPGSAASARQHQQQKCRV